MLQDRPPEAEPFLELALEVMPGDSLDVVNLAHMARATTHLSQGSLVEAEEHARQALAAIVDWEMPKAKGDSLVLLADVLNVAGRADEAIAAYFEALALYEQKEEPGRGTSCLPLDRDAGGGSDGLTIRDPSEPGGREQSWKSHATAARRVAAPPTGSAARS